MKHTLKISEDGDFQSGPGEGLAYCTTCGGGECSLTEECCGRKLTDVEEKQICKGTLNFIRGEWINVF